MRRLALCVLITACVDVDGAPLLEAIERDDPSGLETACSADVEASAFTCSPCPPFQLGRNICCVAVHACCPG